MDDYKNAKWERKPGGTIIIDGKEVAHTQMCAHCGGHFLSVKNMTIRRFCQNCSQYTCGMPKCDACIPFEKRLDMYEKGKLPFL